MVERARTARDHDKNVLTISYNVSGARRSTAAGPGMLCVAFQLYAVECVRRTEERACERRSVAPGVM